MSYNESLVERIEDVLISKSINFEAKKMMGGICFMIDDKMCIGVNKDDFMARVHPDQYEELLTRKGAREMDFTKRPMKGFLFVDQDGTDLDRDLAFWIDTCLTFNPLARSSKKG